MTNKETYLNTPGETRTHLIRIQLTKLIKINDLNMLVKISIRLK